MGMVIEISPLSLGVEQGLGITGGSCGSMAVMRCMVIFPTSRSFFLRVEDSLRQQRHLSLSVKGFCQKKPTGFRSGPGAKLDSVLFRFPPGLSPCEGLVGSEKARWGKHGPRVDCAGSTLRLARRGQVGQQGSALLPQRRQVCRLVVGRPLLP